MLERLQQKDFAQNVNSRFKVRTKDGEVAEMTLVAVTGREDEATETFSLLFKALTPGVLAHDTHAVTHDTLGTFDLFLGPVVTGKTDGVYYQAVFSRLKSR
ncbi:MAG: hypothetical protein HGA76_06415 [Candidatus Firestonebacteria bacterium]|nr:hypothetical protein [Candidatus Firestonebacteria bacterium]